MVTTRRGAAAHDPGSSSDAPANPLSSSSNEAKSRRGTVRTSDDTEPVTSPGRRDAKPAASLPAAATRGAASRAAAPAAAKVERAKSPAKLPAKSPAKPVKTSSSKAGFPYEFGGPLGALGIVLGLPLVVLFLAWASKGDLLSTASVGAWLRGLWATVSSLEALKDAATSHILSAQSLLSWAPWAKVLELWDLKWFGIYVAWFLFQVVLERVLPAEVHLGVPLPGSQKRLEYRVNGHLAFWVSLLVMGHGCPTWDGGRITGFTAFPLEQLYDNFGKLAFSAIVFSYLLSAYIYATSFLPRRLLAEGGKSGNPVYDFYIGRELNPRIGSFDWKYFCELRPGLIGWVVLNLGMLKHKFEAGALTGNELWPILLVNLFQGWYVVDALFHEKAILTTMDITTDGFGFMLVFGDLAWVPFTYSLQAKYLAKESADLPTWALVGICVLNVAGYTIFRQANSIKDQFRQDPSKVPHIRFLETARGTRLMTSSWWGWARKINYTGDWMMGLAWCLLSGTGHLVPYFYAIYFGILLVHRAARDDHACAAKYGKDWDEYKKAVPYRFIPKVY